MQRNKGLIYLNPIRYLHAERFSLVELKIDHLHFVILYSVDIQEETQTRKRTITQSTGVTVTIQVPTVSIEIEAMMQLTNREVSPGKNVI